MTQAQPSHVPQIIAMVIDALRQRIRRPSVQGMMLTVILSMAAATNAMAAPAPDEPGCTNPKNQTELTDCTDSSYGLADRKLNSIYRQLMLKAGEKDKEYLRMAERAWIAYRDAECKYESSGSEGGTIYSTTYAACLAKKTVAHTKELKSLTNCLEYDLSCKIRK